MRHRHQHGSQDAHRAAEFDAFAAGAGGRLLHLATLLTAEPADANPRARRLLVDALAHTCAAWRQLHGDDPYAHARDRLVVRFAGDAWRVWRAKVPLPRAGMQRSGTVLAGLTTHERLVVVLRLHEGVAEEQAAALLGLSEHRVRALCAGAVAEVLRPRRGGPVALPGAAPS
ncbi:sigma factor-like helix-turn-helix DNA-binding protein [Streptomyces sp. NPDC005955]|uniref:sigma factor-like helix-turn-helix DNA-binding protein n=1 Tax=Streptomyces sp. NPDC005955 TaxID=3364738 RepID=UPI00367EB2D5